MIKHPRALERQRNVVIMAALENIGNLWDQLSELHQKDPQKYQEVIEESAKEYAKLKLPPLPHTCLLIREKVLFSMSICFINCVFVFYRL